MLEFKLKKKSVISIFLLHSNFVAAGTRRNNSRHFTAEHSQKYINSKSRPDLSLGGSHCLGNGLEAQAQKLKPRSLNPESQTQTPTM